MADNDLGENTASRGPAPPAARPRRRWLLPAALALLATGGVLAVLWLGPTGQPDAGPLDGQLVVIIRSPERAAEPLAVEAPGAVPVRADGLMSLEVQFNQPAFAYLVWLDTEGRVVPLYPWNPETLEVTDVNQPPPVRRPAKVVYSPPLGGGWRFGKKGGLETVLLLARRTPLDEGTRLGPLLGPLPPPGMRQRDEVVVLGLNAGADSVSTLLAQNRGPEDDARAADEPLRALLLRLRDHFELIRAVRFAHEGE
jgi:hypothetical protein